MGRTAPIWSRLRCPSSCRRETLIGLFALDANHEFHYSRYFSMISGRSCTQSFVHRRILSGRGKAKSEAADRRSGGRGRRVRAQCLRGARDNAKTFGFKVIYDKTFPPGTTDFSPIIRALQAANADLVVLCSYPLSSVGLLQAANELNFTPKMLGGAMVGLQSTAFKES